MPGVDDLLSFSTPSLQVMSQAAGPVTGYGVERLRSDQAGVRVVLETERFNAALTQFITATRGHIRFELTALALQLNTRIKYRTPVRTGRLRNSFHAVLPGSSDTYFYSDLHGKSFNGVLYEHPRAQDDDQAIEAVVGTNVDYAIYIEAGHSRQAPNGMVAVSLAEMAGALEAAVEKAMLQAQAEFRG